MTRYELIKVERARKRAKDAFRVWNKLSDFFGAKGIRAKMFGSIAEDRNDENSDLDVMVYGDLSVELIREVIKVAQSASAAEQVPVDLIFERDFPELAKGL